MSIVIYMYAAAEKIIIVKAHIANVIIWRDGNGKVFGDKVWKSISLKQTRSLEDLNHATIKRTEQLAKILLIRWYSKNINSYSTNNIATGYDIGNLRSLKIAELCVASPL